MNYSTTLAACFSLSILSACGSSKRPSAPDSGPYKALVVAFKSVDANGRGRFGLEERTFNTLTNLDDLDGTYAKISRGGVLKISEVNGSIVEADSFSGGESPSLRYNLDGGTVIAADYSTLAMLSGYYQLDWIYSNVSDVWGIDPKDLAAKLPGGKHTVLFEPEIKITTSGANASAGIKLNAAFSPQDKKFLLFQRSPVENVPLAGNLQVLSHEFGHFIFDFTFFNSVYDKDNLYQEIYAMRGLNEGFADFSSWLFTNCADVLRGSLDIPDYADERFFTKNTFTWDQVVQQDLGLVAKPSSHLETCTGSFYCIGTLLARSLYQSQVAMNATVSKKEFAQDIVASMKKAQDAIKSMPASIVPAPLEHHKDDPTTTTTWEEQGQFTSAFIRALIQNMPTALQPTLCTKFSDNFGTSQGFTAAARSGVCN